MRKLILDLLDATRLESGQRPRNLTQVDLRQIAIGIAESLKANAESRGITLHIHAAAPCLMTADTWEMETIFSNLISNAIKYNRDQGRVEITISEQDNTRLIQVADTGIGIAPEDAGRLFQEFARIRNPQTDAISGSGLGLSIVKKVAQLYQGEVFLESRPGKGSVFTVFLQNGLFEVRRYHSIF